MSNPLLKQIPCNRSHKLASRQVLNISLEDLWDVAWHTAWNATWDVVRDVAWDAVWDTVQDVVRDVE